MPSSPVKREDLPAGKATAQINCAYAFAAAIRSRGRQSSFKMKLL